MTNECCWNYLAIPTYTMNDVYDEGQRFVRYDHDMYDVAFSDCAPREPLLFTGDGTHILGELFQRLKFLSDNIVV